LINTSFEVKIAAFLLPLQHNVWKKSNAGKPRSQGQRGSVVRASGMLLFGPAVIYFSIETIIPFYFI
jgi:hypothetical protein